jgi:ribosomal protein S2
MKYKMNNLIKLLFSLGAHIGQPSELTSSMSYNYLLGFYKNRAIINLKSTIFLFKKSLFLLKNKHFKWKLLFYIGSLFLYSSEIKYTFVNIVYFKYKQSIFEEYWFPSLIHNINNIDSIFIHLFRQFKKVKTNYFDLLSRIIFYTYSHRIFGISYKNYFKKIIRFWRLFYIFKFFKQHINLPDSFIYLNALSISSPINEMSRLLIPVIATIDTDMLYNAVSYPIICNDRSILLLLFFIYVILNVTLIK